MRRLLELVRYETENVLLATEYLVRSATDWMVDHGPLLAALTAAVLEAIAVVTVFYVVAIM